MNIQRYSPTESLKPFIKGYIIIESKEETENLILPDTSMVMSIRYKGSVSINDNKLPGAILSGLRHTHRNVRYSSDSGNVLIAFEPGGVAAFFEEPLHELVEISVPLDSLKNYINSNEVCEQLHYASDNAERISIVERMLILKIRNQKFDALVFHAVEKIRKDPCNMRIKELLETLNISRDAFEKRFRRTIGTTPKQFSNIVRMKSVIEKGKEFNSLTDLAYESGYFDQAHFNKEFKLFTGQTPSVFFKSTPLW
ncbi:MAG: helix-turn-helix transcriptional regulator [Sporocytophaga sp.]|uniref:helix-turn-helix transcriptional regulator n=1 Tax=Sporocytophaga sp. TaxID=2231183 RepID=UPI001B1DAC7E|nr:helix-turn-helix transcriptional regulator [Sporocytophaga sp.]MBO9702718.1 helix-turn-helix transcriptional regulator [Sporocytophaga sp.]